MIIPIENPNQLPKGALIESNALPRDWQTRDVYYYESKAIKQKRYFWLKEDQPKEQTSWNL